jgi:hypothetical protein
VRQVEAYLHLNGFVERCRVEPLQIIEEYRERVFRPREYVDEAPEDRPEPVLSGLRWKSRTGGCGPIMSFNSGTGSTMSDPLGSSAY